MASRRHRPFRRARAAVRALACLAATVLAACGGGDGEEDRRQAARLDLVVGSSIPLSGDLAAYGPAARKATRLAAERIRAAARRAGTPHRITVLRRDNGTDPATAVSGARELVRGGADCLVGAWASADSLAIAEEVAVPEKVLQISPASTAGELTELDDDGLLMRTAPPDELEGRALEQAISDALGGVEGRLANLGARDDDYGEALAEAFREPWRDAGGAIGEDVSYEATDFRDPAYAEAAGRITGGDPDAFVIADYPESFDRLAPALSETGRWDPRRAWATAALASPLLGAEVGESAVDGMRGVTPAVPREASPSRAFAQLYGRSPPVRLPRARFDAQAFDAVVLCYLAAVAAGSAEGEEMAESLIDLTAPEGTEYDWRQLPGAVAALQRGEDIDYTGASGPIDMDENGDPTAASFDIYRHSPAGLRVIGQVKVEPDGDGG